MTTLTVKEEKRLEVIQRVFRGKLTVAQQRGKRTLYSYSLLGSCFGSFEKCTQRRARASHETAAGCN
jgi:hypothetical protein